MEVMHKLRLLSLAFIVVFTTLFATACSGDRIIIGIIEPDLADGTQASRDAFVLALKDAGFKAGENVQFQRRNGEFRKNESNDDFAKYLVEKRHVEYFFVMSPEALEAAGKAANGRPIVYAFVASAVNRPPNAVGYIQPPATTLDFRALGTIGGKMMVQVLNGTPLAEVHP